MEICNGNTDQKNSLIHSRHLSCWQLSNLAQFSRWGNWCQFFLWILMGLGGSTIYGTIREIVFWILLNQTNFRLICHQTEFHLVLNWSGKCNYNPNLVWFYKIQNTIYLCEWIGISLGHNIITPPPPFKPLDTLLSCCLRGFRGALIVVKKTLAVAEETHLHPKLPIWIQEKANFIASF